MSDRIDVVTQIERAVDRATQDFDGKDEILRRASDEVLRLRRELSEARNNALEETWQPIDTAPTDGSTILAYFPLEGLGDNWCRVMPVFYSKRMEPRPWIFAGRAASSYGDGPTHWMRLPSPPAAAVRKLKETGE